MEWLNLIKYAITSKLLMFAIFCSVVPPLLGGQLLPMYIDPPPKEYTLPLFLSAVFTGVFLVYWMLEWAISICKKLYNQRHILLARRLTENEEKILVFIANGADETLNIKKCKDPLLRLEIEETVKNLDRKGLVERNPFGDHLVTLRSVARPKVARILRARQKN